MAKLATQWGFEPQTSSSGGWRGDPPNNEQNLQSAPDSPSGYFPQVATPPAIVAALFVEQGGAYDFLPGVDCWPESRDARLYRGPHPVVAHPPCERWGRYWSGGPSAKVRRFKGDDGGLFAHALWCVRTFGGVLEHPEASWAWRWFGLRTPSRAGGWLLADNWGWTCCVEQGHYGHPARKATWLYAAKVRSLPELTWGPASGCRRLDEGYHSKAERSARHEEPRDRLTPAECMRTPPTFRDVLLDIARRAS